MNKAEILLITIILGGSFLLNYFDVSQVNRLWIASLGMSMAILWTLGDRIQKLNKRIEDLEDKNNDIELDLYRLRETNERLYSLECRILEK